MVIFIDLSIPFTGRFTWEMISLYIRVDNELLAIRLIQFLTMPFTSPSSGAVS
jgi:hypothetical protein